MVDAVSTVKGTQASKQSNGLAQIGLVIWKHLKSSTPQILSLFAGLLAWEILGRLLDFRFFPPLSSVLQASWELIVVKGVILDNLATSLISLAIGYPTAAVLGVLLGGLMGRYRKVEYVFDPYLSIFLASPNLIWAPVLFVFFGISRTSQYAIVFLYTFWYVVASTLAGVRTVDGSLVEMAGSFGASERQIFREVILPGALPLTMAGLRIGIGRAVKGMIAGEMFIALIGLGALIKTYGSRFDTERVLGILIIIVAVAMIGTGVVQAVDRRVTRAWPD